MRNPLVGSQLSFGLPEFKVVDLFDRQTRMWRDPLLAVLFPNEIARAIRSIFIFHWKRWMMSWFGRVLGMGFFQSNLHIYLGLKNNSKGFLDKSRVDSKKLG